MSPGRKIELAAPTSHARAESQPVCASVVVDCGVIRDD
jgi:hypothetical protein